MWSMLLFFWCRFCFRKSSGVISMIGGLESYTVLCVNLF